MNVNDLKEKVIAGLPITRNEALSLADAPLTQLTSAADEIRQKICGNAFDLCTIVNAKCGKCSEDCKYCAQSAHYHTSCQNSYCFQQRLFWNRRRKTTRAAFFATQL